MTFTPPRRTAVRPWNHLKIGLFGGTFNPPHDGHLHICDVALKKGDFDFIWWMVTPQNPLKSGHHIPDFEERMAWSRAAIHHPRVLVTDIEQQIGTYKSIDTIKKLKTTFPKTHFTFIAGTDNAMNLHKWEEWQCLMKEVPFMFIARPPAIDLVKKYPARIIHHGDLQWILETKLVDRSSTQIRRERSFS